MKLAILILIPLLAGAAVLWATLPLAHSYNSLSYQPLENPFPGMEATPPEAVIRALEIPDWVRRWRPFDVEDVAVGKKLYEVNCAVCHGKNLDGRGEWASVFNFPASPPAFAEPLSPLEHASIQYIFWRINEGGIQNQFNTAMPRWGTWGIGPGGRQETVHSGDLSTEEIWEIIRYLYRATEKKPVIDTITPGDDMEGMPGMDM